MLDFIKSQLQSRMPTAPNKTETNETPIPDETILEYAQFIQECGDLSIEGSDAGRARKMAIDIPLEDDIELESIEIDLAGARVLDIPADATVQEEYRSMKTYDDFFQEACGMITKLPRETESGFNKRAAVIAEKNYNEYCAEIKREGLFGFDKVNIGDESVPSKINVDLGPVAEGSDKSFFTKLKVLFETDKQHNVMKKQLDPIALVQEGAFSKIGGPLMEHLQNTCDVPRGSGVWDIATPTRLIVPRGVDESFCVVLEFFNEITKKHDYFGWTRSIKPINSGSIENSIIQEGCNKESFNPEAIKADLERSLKEDQEAPTYSGEDAFKELSTFFSKDNANGIEEGEIEKYNHAMTKIGDLFSDVDDISIPKSRNKVQFRGKFNKSMSGYIKISFMNKTKILVQAKAAGEEWFEKVTPSKKYKDFEKVIKQLEKWLNGKTKGNVNESYIDDCVATNMEAFLSAERYENHDEYLQEAAETEKRKKTRKAPSRFYQEAIEGFDGGSSESGDAGSDLPPAEDDSTAADTDAPSTDGGNEDASVDTGNASDAPEANSDSSDKEEANVNDVSKEIAERVAEKTQEDTPSDDFNNTEVTFDDDSDSMSDTGVDNNTGDSEATVDEQLDDLDSAATSDEGGSDDAEMDDMGSGEDVDINNLTIDQLMEQGSEKLKGMTLQEIKNFLSTGNPEAIQQEAFFITKKNINKELDINLRKVLGILNDNKMDVIKLLKSLKVSGKKLNSILTKALKMKEVYSSDEMDDIKSLNKILVDLLAAIPAKYGAKIASEKEAKTVVSRIKGLIRKFLDQSKIVAAFVEDKLNGNTVQEGFVMEGAFITVGNVRKKVLAETKAVNENMATIVELDKAGKFNKGRLIKMYYPKNRKVRFSEISPAKTIDAADTQESKNIEKLIKILNKATGIQRISKNFTKEEIGVMSKLSSTLEELIDDIEAVILDPKRDPVKMLGIIVKEAGEVSKNIEELQNMWIDDSKEMEKEMDSPETDNDDVPETDENTTNEPDTDLPELDDLDADNSGSDDTESTETEDDGSEKGDDEEDDE